jgi:hypothetical protein
MLRSLRRVVLAGVMLSGTATPMLAQSRGPSLSVTVPDAPGLGATVTASNLFSQTDLRELVRAGFPALLRYRVELWRTGGLFDDLEGRSEWQLIVQYDPSAQRYGVIRRQANKLEDAGNFATLATAQTVIERPVRTTLTPEVAGARYYYVLNLDIEALSVSDMDQLERWLRGVRTGTAAAAVGSGLRTLMLRMLGGEKKNYTAKSSSFVAER